MFKLPFLNKKHSQETKFLALDLNYESVKCLAFYKEDGTIKIIGSAQEPLEGGYVRNGVVVDLDGVLETVRIAIENATAGIEEDISNVIVGTSSDLCIETVTTAKITRASDKRITEREISEFENKIMDSAYIQVQNKFSENTGNVEEDFQVVTSSNIYSKLNGEKVDSLLEKEGNTVELAMYTAHCPDYYIKTLQKVAKKLKLNILAIASVNFALLKALKHSELESNDAVTIQVSEDFTNVSVIFGGAIVSNKSLHIGKKHFIDEVSRIMGLTVEEASKVVETHARGELSSSESVVVQNCMEDVLDLWLEGIELLFSDFSGVKTFAPHIYLYGTATKLPEIEETLTKNPWTKSIPFKAPPTVQMLKLGDLPKLVDATGMVTEAHWIIPAALSFIYEELA